MLAFVRARLPNGVPLWERDLLLSFVLGVLLLCLVYLRRTQRTTQQHNNLSERQCTWSRPEVNHRALRDSGRSHRKERGGAGNEVEINQHSLSYPTPRHLTWTKDNDMRIVVDADQSGHVSALQSAQEWEQGTVRRS